MTDEAKAQADAAGVDAQVELVEERGADALLALAERHDARFIVVGDLRREPAQGRDPRLDSAQAAAPLAGPGRRGACCLDSTG